MRLLDRSRRDAGDLPAPRPLGPADVDAVDALAARSFDDLAARRGLAEPSPPRRGEADRTVRRGRIAHLQATHGDGCWVIDAPTGDRVAAVALALRREGFWGLSLMAVDPDHQGAGAGTAVLRAALASADGCARRMILASPDPPALRAYARAGFSLHPALRLEGAIDRRRLPARADPGVREGAAADREWIDELDRRRRGAPHGADLEHMLAQGGRLLVVDRGRARGYAVAWQGGVGLLAADHVACARALVWRILAESDGGDTGVSFAGAAHQWLVRLALDAGLPVRVQGAICTVGFAPPATYLPNGAWL